MATGRRTPPYRGLPRRRAGVCAPGEGGFPDVGNAAGGEPCLGPLVAQHCKLISLHHACRASRGRANPRGPAWHHRSTTHASGIQRLPCAPNDTCMRRGPPKERAAYRGCGLPSGAVTPREPLTALGCHRHARNAMLKQACKAGPRSAPRLQFARNARQAWWSARWVGAGRGDPRFCPLSSKSFPFCQRVDEPPRTLYCGAPALGSTCGTFTRESWQRARERARRSR